MDKTYIIGNWKMNLRVEEAAKLLDGLTEKVKGYRDVEVVLAPSLVLLSVINEALDRRKFKLAAQNFYHRDFGAFTGEVSINQLRGMIEYGMVGHSERRHIFNESENEIKQKVAAAIRHKVRPILCIGETESQRTFGETGVVLRDQLMAGLAEVSEEEVEKVIIAYEPVWAISSSAGAKPAMPEDVAEAIKLIRAEIKAMYGAEMAKKMIVMFGGSVSTANAGAYLMVPGCNGLLIGGASLKVDDFTEIVEIAKRVRE